RWKALSAEVAETRRKFGQDTALGRRRTVIGTAPTAVVVPIESFIEREPLTVFLSEKGWIRAVKGHVTDTSDVKYKEGDQEGFVLHAETVDKILLFASNGRFYTLSADKLPRGRGFGEPVRLMLDLANDASVVNLLRHRPDGRL